MTTFICKKLRDTANTTVPVLFSDYFNVPKEALDEYGAFNISLVSDLPLFIDPFHLFNSEKQQHRELHDDIIRYLRFLRDKSLAGEVTSGLRTAWYRFKEVKQTWLGFSGSGNRGIGLGTGFASTLDANLYKLFAVAEQVPVTKGNHLEKLCLIESRVGRDKISDFTTNLIKNYLLTYTQTFARKHLKPHQCRSIQIERVRFNYDTESWETRAFFLPFINDDYVLLTPKELLTRDETWINRTDLYDDFNAFPSAIPDEALRAQVNNYFRQALPEDPTGKERHEAIQKTIREYPALIDYYIRYKELHGDRAKTISGERVTYAEHLFLQNFARLVALLETHTAFYDSSGTTYEEAYSRVLFLKQVVEKNDGYRLFYDSHGQPIKREEDLQIAYRLVWYGTRLDVSREVNNGRGPVDFKISLGAIDSTLVEFKLASNTQLKRNLEKQVPIYENANQTKQSIKVILYFDRHELSKVERTLKELGLSDNPNIVLIDARRDNKPSASRA